MKKISISAIILSVIISFNYSAAAELSPAASAFLSGGRAVPVGLGGAGVSASGAEFYNINPASIAGSENFTLGLDYGSLNGEYIYPTVSAALPFGYGVFGLSFSYFSFTDDDVEQKGYFVSAGLSKEMTSRFMFGLSFEYGSSDYPESSAYAGVKPGIKYIVGSTGSVTGFGIYDFSLGLSAGLGYSSAEEGSLNTVTAGYSFDFYRDRLYSFGIYNDVSAVNSFGEYPVKLGLEALVYNDFALRGGVVFPDSYDFMTYTCGAGYRFEGEYLRGSINYALAYSGENGINHYAGLTMEIGGVDREPPVIAITPDHSYISPNYDGIKDYLIFDIDVRDTSRITGWRLQIADDSDNVVREFKISEREIEAGLTPSTFFGRFFGRKESLVVPEKILWDGSDAAGKKLPDGRYRYYFYAWDSKDNIAPVKSGAVFIDNTPPSAGIKADSLIFSPNNDKKKDTLVIEQNIVTSPDDLWKGEIRDDSGNVVFSRNWEGRDIPSKFIWDGTDNSGNLLPDGLYYYSISSSDKAGNSASADLKEIILTTKMEMADIRTETSYYSYRISRGRGIRFFPELSSVKGLERWELAVFRKEDKPLRVLSGGKDLPGFIDWDCMDSEGKELDDGGYSFRFYAWYVSGNNPVSYPKRFIFDSTPPEVRISHEPSLFSPDGDGENDYLTLSMTGSDNTGVASWEIGIYTESGILFKKFAGKGEPPSQLKWDGIGDDGELVESASDYEVRFSAVDTAGNVSEKATGRISVDVLVVVTERGLKIRISNIEFAFGSSALRKRGTVVLDRVYQILEKYSSYDIVIEGHTDDIGGEEYNLTLSEKRALAVRDYLVRKGTAPERLKYVGMGESLPFYPNTNDENRRRNRRVEFLLNRKKIE
ncbi:MAG TPA: OmpA family protein [Spirochaetota bacterium]|nr:OmpA family protein [Spirochaetota bacterium]